MALTHAQMMDAVRAHNERQIVALVRGLLDLAAAIPTAERGELDAEARRLLDQAEKLGIR